MFKRERKREMNASRVIGKGIGIKNHLTALSSFQQRIFLKSDEKG